MRSAANNDLNPRIPLEEIDWNPAFRIISSRFPIIQLFERIADKDDLSALFYIENLTNDRLRDEAGQIRIIPEEERVYGPGSHYIMAPFTHLSPTGSRFSDGNYGVFYASLELQTAISETKHHRESFLRATRQPPIQCEMRVLTCQIKANLHNILDFLDIWPALYDPYSYVESQSLGTKLKKNGSSGILFHSVRQKGGHCAALFKPKAIKHCKQERHLAYHWDGEKIAHVYEIKEIKL
jgi:hypothetical protein